MGKTNIEGLKVGSKKWFDYINEQYADEENQILRLTGFDDCVIGLVERCGEMPFLVYDPEKCIRKLVKVEGMSYTEAVEHFSHNVSGSWVGKTTPGFLTI